MVRLTGVLFVFLLLTSSAFADGPANVISPLENSGTTNPILVPWGLDVITWTQVGTAPLVFGRSGGGVLGNYMYEFGSEGTGIAQAYNLTTETWQAATPAPYGYDNYASATTDSSIYIIGGYNGTTTYLQWCQRFTPTGGGPTGAWTQMAPYPLHVLGATAAWNGGDLIYVAGGYVTSGYSLTAYKYSISANTWTQLANPPVSQSFSGSSFLNGKFYVFGGTDAAGLGTRHYAYDPAANTWSLMAPAPTAVWFATSSTTFNGTYMFSVGGGGGYGSWPATNAVQVYNPASNSWSQETPLPQARGCNLARWTSTGRIISGGGADQGGWYSGITYKGDGFGAPNVTLDLAYTSGSPVPPGGGPLGYSAFLTNNESSALPFQYWCTYSQGTTVIPAFGPISRVSPAGPGYVINRSLTQLVTGLTTGAWNYNGYIGSYPASIWASDTFPFSQSLSQGESNYPTGICLGWENEEPGVVAAMPANFSLQGARPNPFNPMTAISYQLSTNSFVSLRVYDTAGRMVAELVNGWREAGMHEAIFDGSHLVSGIYVYQLTAGNFSVSGKMVLMK